MDLQICSRVRSGEAGPGQGPAAGGRGRGRGRGRGGRGGQAGQLTPEAAQSRGRLAAKECGESFRQGQQTVQLVLSIAEERSGLRTLVSWQCREGGREGVGWGGVGEGCLPEPACLSHCGVPSDRSLMTAAIKASVCSCVCL